jgi:hypothetical protein
MLKSKACRSAIMFGDELSEQQCVQLVQQLQATQLCFQCAHGRPTMAPVVDLKALSAAASSRHGHRKELAAAAVAAASKKRAGSSGTAAGGGSGKVRRLTVEGLRAAMK